MKLAQPKQADSKAVADASVQRKKSNAASLPGVVQRVTNIHFQTGNYTYTGPMGPANQQVGMQMDAHLDPGDPKTGSAPNAQQALLARMRGLYPAANIVRGHLLNGNLGGLGVAENLYPITTSANRRHEREVENHVKWELRAGNEVDYRVVVNGNPDEATPDATLECTIWDNAGNMLLDKDIVSTPGGGMAGFGNAQTYAGTGWFQQRSIAFRNNTLPPGFGQVGAGLAGNVRGTTALGQNHISDPITGALHANVD